jgi:hypothetical protein
MTRDRIKPQRHAPARLPFVAEPQQRHQHEGKGGEGGRYQDQRRQLVMEQMIEQE